MRIGNRESFDPESWIRLEKFGSESDLDPVWHKVSVLNGSESGAQQCQIGKRR
jgi:hypothetical protein